MRAAALALVALSIPAIAGQRVEVAKGWFLNCGSQVERACAEGGPYVGALDTNVVSQGAASFSISSETSAPPAFGGVMQIARAAEFRGKRIRYSAEVRTRDVTDWTGLWLRVDGPDGKILAFDNMQTSGRALSGSHEWERESVVLDVPQEANAIYFGLVLSGSGKAWLDAVRIQAVTPDFPVTKAKGPMTVMYTVAVPADRLQPPRNLDFEE